MKLFIASSILTATLDILQIVIRQLAEQKIGTDLLVTYSTRGTHLSVNGTITFLMIQDSQAGVDTYLVVVGLLP